MNAEESMHSVFIELNNLRKTLAAIQEQKQIQKKKEFVAQINGKFQEFSCLIKTMNEYQERINNKRNTIVHKIPEKSLSTNNSLQLAYTHHSDFVNVTLSKPKIEELINNYQTNADKNTDIKSVLNEFKHENSNWRTNFFEQLCEYRSAKGLLDNIQHLKTIDINYKDDTSAYEQSDSDLGCYPNDSTEENTTALLQFVTSSPIYKQ